MCSHERASVSLRQLQDTWSNKMDAEAAIPWSSLAKHSKVGDGQLHQPWQEEGMVTKSTDPKE